MRVAGRESSVKSQLTYPEYLRHLWLVATGRESPSLSRAAGRILRLMHVHLDGHDACLDGLVDYAHDFSATPPYSLRVYVGDVSFTRRARPPSPGRRILGEILRAYTRVYEEHIRERGVTIWNDVKARIVGLSVSGRRVLLEAEPVPYMEVYMLYNVDLVPKLRTVIESKLWGRGSPEPIWNYWHLPVNGVFGVEVLMAIVEGDDVYLPLVHRPPSASTLPNVYVEPLSEGLDYNEALTPGVIPAYRGLEQAALEAEGIDDSGDVEVYAEPRLLAPLGIGRRLHTLGEVNLYLLSLTSDAKPLRDERIRSKLYDLLRLEAPEARELLETLRSKKWGRKQAELFHVLAARLYAALRERMLRDPDPRLVPAEHCSVEHDGVACEPLSYCQASPTLHTFLALLALHAAKAPRNVLEKLGVQTDELIQFHRRLQ